MSSVGTEAAFVASGSVVDGIPCVRLDSVLGNAQRSCLFLKINLFPYLRELFAYPNTIYMDLNLIYYTVNFIVVNYIK